MKKPPTCVMKGLVVRFPSNQIRHIKKRAKEQKHYRLAEVIRRLVAADMARPVN